MCTIPTLSRAGLTRLVAVFAALVAMALIDGIPCHAAMSSSSTAMAMAHPNEVGIAKPMSVSTNIAVDTMQSVATDSVSSAALLLSGVRQPVQAKDAMYEGLSPTPVGVVMACLAVFLALLAVLVMVRPDVTVSPLPVVHPRGLLPRRTVRSWTPSLHELCILRT